MKCNKVFFWITILASLTGTLQVLAADVDTVQVNSLLQQAKERYTNDPAGAINLARKAYDLARSNGFVKGEALALKAVGIVYYNQGKYVEATDYWSRAKRLFSEAGDKVGVANMLSNIGAIYFNQGDDEKALSHYLQSLRLAEEAGDKVRVYTALNNVGAVYEHKPENWNKAIDYYTRALAICEKLQDGFGIGTLSGNIGELYGQQDSTGKALFYLQKSLDAFSKGDVENKPSALNSLGKLYAKDSAYQKAYAYHKEAYEFARTLNGKYDMVQSLLGMANAHAQLGNLPAAKNDYLKAKALGEEVNMLRELKDVYDGLAKTYALANDYRNAFYYHELFASIKDSLYNNERDKKIALLQFDFDLQKKQGEINLLMKDRSLKEVELKRQRIAKNASIAGLVFLVVIAVILYRNYRVKVRVNQLLDKQKDEIEGLLLNILPAEVAQELRQKGQATPRNYERVSILFSDFNGFTSIADKMEPSALVEDLSECFMAFDDIIDKYNLEKIKTIGDAYMCAGGIPTPDIDHPFRIVRAALEMQAFMLSYNQKRLAKGLLPWQMRIGINVGAVVAGVVGRKKYAYDIWGSSVNVASRMESNSTPGRVNISAATYEIVKGEFACSYRGKISAKNVGEIDMYFVDKDLVAKAPVSFAKAFQQKTSISYDD
ncbi:adenylate/guanylate cyclase domain-containing protein [Cnuella takakiae]|nr:adenylate/guanylate cyclase domain-containing protein [Cnuella takakiae]